MGSPAWKRIAAVAIALFLFSYVGYQVYNTNHVKLRTETAIYGSTWDTMQVDATVIRKESLVARPVDGIAYYTAQDSSHVANGGVIAEIYKKEQDIVHYQRAQALQEEINQLQKLNHSGDAYALSPNVLDKKISEQLLQLVDRVQARDLNEAQQEKETMQYLLNQRLVVTGQTENFDERIEMLSQQLAALQAGLQESVGQVLAPAAGYFISEADGYENSFDYDTATELSVEDLRELPVPEKLPDETIGKISGHFLWYAAFVVDAETAITFKALQNASAEANLRILFPFVSGEEALPARVAAVNQETIQDDAAIILECEYLNANIAAVRQETMQIELHSYEGVMVSQDAVHFETVTWTQTDEAGNETTQTAENVKGLYRKNGVVLEYVQIFSDMTVGGYVICREPKEGEVLYTKNKVELYDEVITEGKDLWDGKVIE